MSSIPSLGDGGKLKLIQETWPLPGNRKEILNAIEGILNLGKVQKVVVEVGQPIRFSRVVDKELKSPEETSEDDTYALIRNSEMLDFDLESNPAFLELLFKSFAFLTQRRHFPKFFAISSFSNLRSVLKVDVMFDLSELFGIEVKSVKEVPEDVILLCGTKSSDSEQLSLSLRMILPGITKGTRKDEATDGDDSEERVDR